MTGGDMADKPLTSDALKAAGMLWLGLPQTFVAQQLGITTATLRTWRSSDWWPAINRQAESGHLDRMVGKARRVLDSVMEAGLAEGATSRDRKEAFTAARFLLEKQDNSFKQEPTREDRQGLPQNLAELSVGELRALLESRNAPRQLTAEEFEVAPTTDCLDVDFEELAHLPEQAAPALPSKVKEADSGTFYLDDDDDD